MDLSADATFERLDLPQHPPLGIAFSADGLLDTLPWGVLVLDEQHVVRRVNQQAARWCGALPESLLGRPLAEASLLPAVRATLLQLLEPGEAAPLELWLPEHEQWIALSATRQPGGWVLYGHGITPQKQREQQYQALAESIPDVLTRWGPDLRLRYANAVFADKAGVPPAELLGRTNREMGQPEPIAGLYMAALQRVFDTGQSQEHFNAFPTPHGEVYYYSRLVPELRDGQVETVLGIARDITELKQAETVILRRVATADAFRLQLADALGPLADPAAIQEAVTRLARQHFAADRCYYVEIEGDQGIIRRDAAADGLPSMAGTYPYADFALLHAVFATGQPFSVRDVRQDASVDENLRQLCVQLQLISYLDVPILKNGQPAGVLCLVQSQPRDWTATELTLAAELAERTWAAVERARAEAALAASEQKYRVLFDSIDEGFASLEVLFDDAGEATDYRIVETNQAYETMTGMPSTVVGWRVRELLPDIEEAVIRRYGEVVRTGEPVRFEQHVAALGRWFDVFSSRMGGTGSRTVASVFNDITARKQQAQQQGFLLRFSDALRAETSAPSVAYCALGMLCEQLQLDRCYIGIYDLAGDRGIFPQQVGNHRILPLPAEVRLSDFPDALRVAYDQTLVIDDLAQTEGLSDTDRQNLGALGMRALVAASLRRGGDGPQWSIVALSADVRHWKPGEVALLEEATERTWAAVQQVQAEEALRQSEEEFRLLVTTTSDTVYRMSADCTQLEQLISKDFLADTLSPSRTWTTNYIPDEDLPLVQATIADAIGRKGPLELEHRVQQADGTVGWAHSRAVPVLDAQGEVTSWLGAATNITARKQAEEALRQAEESHRAELEQQVAARTQELRESSDLLYAIAESQSAYISAFKAIRDEQGRVVDLEYIFINSITEQIASGRQLVGQRYLDVFPEAENAGFLSSFRRVIETGVRDDQELTYDDSQLTGWFRSNATKLDDGVLVVGEDITARKQAEQERLKNLRLLEQAEAVASLGSWDYNLLNQEFLWSDGMYHLFGLPLGQPVRPDIYLQFVVDEDRPQAERLVAGITAGTNHFEETLRLRVGEQVKTVRIKVVVLHDEAGQPVRVLGVDLDISELQRLEADNLRLRLTQQQALFEAVQAAQEEERRRMAESLHNGIGQILYATKLQLDCLPDTSAPGPRYEAARLLGEAIRQTRTLSHELTPALLEEFGLEAALRSICRTLNTPTLHWHCYLVFEEAPTLPLSLQLALYRLAQELAQNVLKHAQATEATLEVEVLPAWVVLRVEDNGSGFDQAHTNDGLGLRTLRSRVALLGGSVHLTTSPSQGTQCQVRLPLPATS